jgi:hypothetical protein
VAVSEKTKRIVWTKAAGRCAICREVLYEGHVSGSDTHMLGEVAHIVADKGDGPRGASPLPPDERDHESNLLLLCLYHHKIIDDDTTAFTIERLQEIKAAHETWLNAQLVLEKAWQTKLHNLYYINVPRLNLLAASAGVSLNLDSYGEIEALHELGWELNRLLAGFENLLSKVELKAIEITAALKDPGKARGMIICFDQDFRTKNIRLPQSPGGYPPVWWALYSAVWWFVHFAIRRLIHP